MCYAADPRVVQKTGNSSRWTDRLIDDDLKILRVPSARSIDKSSYLKQDR